MLISTYISESISLISHLEYTDMTPFQWNLRRTVLGFEVLFEFKGGYIHFKNGYR